MPLDSLTATFAALADPTRRAILAGLALGDATVKSRGEACLRPSRRFAYRRRANTRFAPTGETGEHKVHPYA